MKTEQQDERELAEMARNIPIHDPKTFKPSIRKGQRFNHFDMSYGEKTLMRDRAIADSYLNFEGWELVYGKIFKQAVPIIVRPGVKIFKKRNRILINKQKQL